MLNLNSIMFGSNQPEVLAKFYEALFEKKPDFSDGGAHGWQVGSCFLMVSEHSDATGKAKEPFRILLNLETTEVEKEFNRIKEIEGVEVIKEPYDPGMGGLIATFADPDGNFLQLMPPWEDDAQAKAES